MFREKWYNPVLFKIHPDVFMSNTVIFATKVHRNCEVDIGDYQRLAEMKHKKIWF